MLKHEHFEELCAAASIGQATREELSELEQHASQCEACCRAYADYLRLAAQRYAAAHQDAALSPQEAQECLNSDFFVRRFFQRAEREGIVFSPAVEAEASNAKPVVLPARRRMVLWVPAAIAAGILLAVLTGVSLNSRRDFWSGALGSLRSQPGKAPPPVSVPSALDQRVAELTAANAELLARISDLSARLRVARSHLKATEADLQSVSRDRQKFESERASLEVELRNAVEKLVASQAMAATAQQEIARLRAHTGGVEAGLVAAEVRVRELTEEVNQKSALLEQQRELLALRRDVTDLMGARNLHIVDVVDTDPRGKTRPAFGRIFFTEGKSLIFYAYDLNETKLQKANYEYRVWARKEGQDKQVRSLGIFYSDDKTQRRWVYKCDDPKILREIDSVFVTLERTESDPSRPRGPNLMYAYLRGQPNHP